MLGPLQCRAAGCRPSLQAMLTAHSRRGRCASAYCQPMQSIQRRLTRMQTTQSSVDFVLAYVCRCVLMQTTHPALRVRNAVAACHGFRPLAMVRCGSSWQRRAHCDVRANDLADARGVLLGERRVPARCQPATRPSMLRCRTARADCGAAHLDVWICSQRSRPKWLISSSYSPRSWASASPAKPQRRVRSAQRHLAHGAGRGGENSRGLLRRTLGLQTVHEGNKQEEAIDDGCAIRCQVPWAAATMCPRTRSRDPERSASHACMSAKLTSLCGTATRSPCRHLGATHREGQSTDSRQSSGANGPAS